MPHGQLPLTGAICIRNHQPVFISVKAEKGHLLPVGRKCHGAVNAREQLSRRASKHRDLIEYSSLNIPFRNGVVNIVTVGRKGHSPVVNFRGRDDLSIAAGDGHLPQPEALLPAIIYHMHQPLAVGRDRRAGSFAGACQAGELCRLN